MTNGVFTRDLLITSGFLHSKQQSPVTAGSRGPPATRDRNADPHQNLIHSSYAYCPQQDMPPFQRLYFVFTVAFTTSTFVGSFTEVNVIVKVCDTPLPTRVLPAAKTSMRRRVELLVVAPAAHVLVAKAPASTSEVTSTLML